MRAPAGATVGAPGLGELPWFSFQDFTLTQRETVRINIANGNLLAKANDSQIASPGFGLRFDRSYNGLSTLDGWFGGGWQGDELSDVGLEKHNSYIDYHAPGGHVFRFDEITYNTAWKSPAGSNLTLTRLSGAMGDYYVTDNTTGDYLLFDAFGWPGRTGDRNGVGYNSFRYGYNAPITDPDTLRHHNGRRIDINWSEDQKRVLNLTDSAGRVTEYSYQNNRLSSVKAPDATVTTYSYDTTGRLATIEFPSSSTATSTISFTYDLSHRVTKVTQEPNIETRFAYTAGQTVVTDPNGNTATYTVDTQGRVTATKDALNRTRSQTWTANNDIQTATDALGSGITNYTYDASNNRTGAQLPTGAAASAAYAVGANCSAPNTGTAFQPKCSTDDAGNKRQYEYDGTGNLLKQTNTTTSTPSTDFERTYNSIAATTECGGFTGQICTTKDADGNVTAYAYNNTGDLVSVTPPAPLGKTTYAYDSLGRVASVTDGNNVTTGYQYDIRDRLVKTTFANGQQLRSTWYANGLESARTDTAGGNITFEYDRQGRILRQAGPRAGVSQTYTYDKVGNLLTMTDAAGTTTYSYDGANQLIRLQQPGGTCPSAGSPAANSGCVMFEYDANAVETKRVLPGGASTTTARDASGRPTRITAKAANGSTAVDIGYSYTPVGSTGDRVNVQSRTAYAEQGITGGAVTSYTYDSRNHLTLANEKVGTATTASWGYSYDGNGNRTRQIRSGSTGSTGGTINYTYNAANQLTSSTGQSTAWTYDGAGNQTRNGATGISATFGDRHQATQIGSNTQSFFGFGNTDRLSSGGASFNSSTLGLANRASGSSSQTYTRAPSGQAIGYSAANQWYYVNDHLGSVVGIFSSTGAYSGGYSYSPYGEARATATSFGVTMNPLRYIGGYEDGNGIYKLGARYFEASQARFTQVDPSGQERNPYLYAGGNPTNFSDPSGLDASGACWAQAGQVLYDTAGFIIGSSTIVGLFWSVPQFIEDTGEWETDDSGYFVC